MTLTRLAFADPGAIVKVSCHLKGAAEKRSTIMFDLLAMGMLGGLAGLVIYEIIDEVRGGISKLRDHYHE